LGSALADVMSKPTAMTARDASNIASLFAAGNFAAWNVRVIMSSRAARRRHFRFAVTLAAGPMQPQGQTGHTAPE
jgi:hypothetical protein